MPEIVHVAYPHLFPGLRLRAPSEAIGYILTFADGSRAEATMLYSDAGSEVLDVAAYTTAAGIAIPQRLWTLTERTAHSLELGAHLDQANP